MDEKKEFQQDTFILARDNQPHFKIDIESARGFQKTSDEEPQFTTLKIPVSRHTNGQLVKFSKQHHVPIDAILHSAWSLILFHYAGGKSIQYGCGKARKDKQGNLYLHDSLSLSTPTQMNQPCSTYVENVAATLVKPMPLLSDDIRYLWLHVDKRLMKNVSNEKAIDAKQYALNFVILDKNPIKIQLQFTPKYFTKVSMEQFIKHFVNLLNCMIAQPDKNVLTLDYMERDEKKKLLSLSTPTFNFSFHHNDCAHHLFSQHAKDTPSRIALIDKEKQVSYGELEDISNQLARLLMQNNVTAGDRIAVVIERSQDLIIAMLAIFKLGAIYVPMNPRNSETRLNDMLQDCQPKYILVNRKPHIPKLYEDSVIIFENDIILKSLSRSAINIPINTDAIACIYYTSGNFGKSRGVLIRHNSIVNLIYWYQTFFNVDQSDRSVQFHSLSSDKFICETLPFLASGASVSIIEDRIKLIPEKFHQWIRANKATVCDLPTSYAQILFSKPWPDKSSLRIVKVGGHKLNRLPQGALPFDIWNTYGCVETTFETTFAKLFKAHTPADAQPYNTTMDLPIGTPIANSKIYILNPSMQMVPTGVVGELFVSGVVVSAGYYQRPRATNKRFLKNTFLKDNNEKLFRTGDLVRRNTEGNLEFIGRTDQRVDINGRIIELNKIQSELINFPEVTDVMVTVHAKPNGEKTIAAYLIPNLAKLRFPFQQICLVAVSENNYFEVITEDISREGMCILGFTEKFEYGREVQLMLKLPGTFELTELKGSLMWQKDLRAGIRFNLINDEKDKVNQSMDYYLANNNLAEVLRNAGVKRNLKQALKQKLAAHMIPEIIQMLPAFPESFKGKIDWQILAPTQSLSRTCAPQVITLTPTQKKLTQMWNKVLKVNSIALLDNFFDIGGTSLKLAHLTLEVLTEFSIVLPQSLLMWTPTISAMADYIDTKIPDKEAMNSIIEHQMGILSSAHLSFDITPAGNVGQYVPGILVTGATGFLGTHMIQELLKLTDAKIYCLIRKGEYQTLAQRFMNRMRQYGLEKQINLSNRRIILLMGDVSMHEFGMATEHYDFLSDKIHSIYHCAATNNLVTPYSSLHTTNVNGCLEIIKFASKKINKAIHFISNLASEHKLATTSSKHFYRDGFSLTKAVSEKLFAEIAQRGVTTSIYRLCTLGPATETGIVNTNNELLYLIKGCIQLGAAPMWDMKITLLPVDFASQAITKLSLYQPEKCHTFSITPPHGILWADLIAWLNNYGFTIKLCSVKIWREKLRSISVENVLYPLLSKYLSDNYREHLSDDVDVQTQTALQGLGVKFSIIENDFLQRYINYLCRSGFLTNPLPAHKRRGINPTHMVNHDSKNK